MTSMARPLLLLLLALASFATTSDAAFDVRAELNHPYAGSSLSKYEFLCRAARASKARGARLSARLARALGTTSISVDDVFLSPIDHVDHSVTVGIGTPPQPHTLLFDTGSDLVWTQCALFRGRGMAKQDEQLYDPAKSISFTYFPCSGRLCQEGNLSTKNCTKNKCLYSNSYGSGETEGVLASEIFTFGAHHKVAVPFAFGCGRFSSGDADGPSGLIGVSQGILSLISQLAIPKFSYCLTPFADRKTSPVFFGALANLAMYKTTGPIQTTYLVKNPTLDYFYYVPLVGISLGFKRLDIPVSSLAMGPDGSGGTIVDSGSTMALLQPAAFKAVKKAVLKAVKLPVSNHTEEGYELCFTVPHGLPMEAVQTPPLVLHFDGGTVMMLPRDNYFQEPRAGLMCLAVSEAGAGDDMSIIGNVQHQNMHVLFDVQNQKLSFAPTQCDQI